jgi:hypothetical protein
MGGHKLFYDVEDGEDDVGKILSLPTQFAYTFGKGYTHKVLKKAPNEAQEKFMAEVKRMQDPEADGIKHHVGGAAVGALRDIQRAQQNPDLRVNHLDWVLIRNERANEDVEFCPFQVAVVISVIVNAEDFITAIMVHECGGAKKKHITDPCDVSQTYRPRYKGVDPKDNKEKDIFIEGHSRKKKWMKEVYVTIDPLTIFEWGKKQTIVTGAGKLQKRTLKVIHHQPRVEWSLPDDSLEDIAENAPVEMAASEGLRKKPAEKNKSKKKVSKKIVSNKEMSRKELSKKRVSKEKVGKKEVSKKEVSKKLARKRVVSNGKLSNKVAKQKC